MNSTIELLFINSPFISRTSPFYIYIYASSPLSNKTGWSKPDLLSFTYKLHILYNLSETCFLLELS